MAILPFFPVLKDFFSSLWHLRLFIVFLLLALVLTTVTFSLVESENLSSLTSEKSDLNKASLVTLNDLLSMQLIVFSSGTSLGLFIRSINTFIGYVFLGILIWVIQKKPERSPT